MTRRSVLLHTTGGPLLLLVLVALVAGAAFGWILLPPGSLGFSLTTGVPVARSQAMPVVRASTFPTAPVALPQGRQRLACATSGDLPTPRFPGPTSTGSGPGAWRRQGELAAERHAWQQDLQLGLTWRYASGETSRARRNPTGTADGHPR